MIIDNLEELENIQFSKVCDESNYVKKIYKAFIEVTDLLKKNKELLSKSQVEEIGKPLQYCQTEVERCICQLNQAIMYIHYKYELSCTDKIRSKKRIPVGTVLAITTFSSPYSSFFHKIIPSIICGNIFVFAPSPKACRCSKIIFNLLEECVKKYLPGIEKRIICVDTILVNSNEIVNKLKYDYILFTGKSDTALLLKKQIGYHHAIFETGSNAMAYVDETIENLDRLAEMLVNSAFDQSGMRCIGLKNLFIQEKISERLIDKIVRITEKVPVGNPMNPNVMVGPINDSTLISELINNILLLKSSGYRVLTGGCIQNDNILQPTILLSSFNNKLAVKEMYGPVLCIHVVKSFKDIDYVYYQRSSLNTAFFSKNLNSIKQFIEYCDTCGTICINCGPDKRNDELPFGGLFDENDGKEDLESLIKALSIEQQVIFGD